MPSIDVTIIRRDDPPPWRAAAEHRPLPSDTPVFLAGLEAGMQSGAPSIGIRLDFPEGGGVIAETSLAAWIAATCALRGAFPEAFAGTPLAAP